MKKIVFFIILFSHLSAFGKDVKDFNKVLIEGVQKDIKSDNAERLKRRPSPMRGPASVPVSTNNQIMQEESKIEKKDRQLGNSKW